MSKSALNMYTKTCLQDWKTEISVNSIHPGWVKKLSTAGAPLSTEFSANGIFKLIETEMGTGNFLERWIQENVVVKKTQHT
jgi:NAD(P)-dependent dehydrogenase (short-subunit alcohol dehydrogenase family)